MGRHLLWSGREGAAKGLTAAFVLGITTVLAGCGGGGGAKATPEAAPAPSTQVSKPQRFPDVVDVLLEPAGRRTYEVRVTISSPYDSPERYADGWRVTTPDGTVLAEHALEQHRADRQPFTSEKAGVRIPQGIDTVVVEGRDSEHGYGGRTVTVPVDQPDS